MDTPVPLFNYVAHVRLVPVTDGGRTFWEWRCSFSTRKGEEEEMTRMVGEDIYDAGFAANSFPACRIGGIGGPRMSVTVRTFARLADAAGALSSERGARFLAGGTLGMRAVNEADPAIETIVRSTDPTFSHISASSGRVELGAGVTMAAILAERELAFLHPVARAVGGPAVREAATVGGNLFAPSPYGDFAAALLALDATVVFASSSASAKCRSKNFSAAAIAAQTLVASVSFKRPVAQTFPVRENHPRSSKGISVLSIAAQLPLASGRVNGARIAYNAIDKTPVRAKAAERALEGRALTPPVSRPRLRSPR